MSSQTTVLLLVAIAAVVGAAAAVAMMLLVLRRESPHQSLLLLQQQLDALRGQTGQSLEAAARAVAERTDSLQAQLTARLDEVTRAVAERLAENAQVLQRVNDSLGQRLDSNLAMVGQRFSETASLVTSVREKLTGLEEAASRIFEVGRDLASLQEILQPPKMRGGVGEVLLESLLRDRLPQGRYAMQHRFRNGTVVDAVIRLEDRLVPIDSKFPLESFQSVMRAASDEERARARREFLRTVQGHIKVIAEKYIAPGEGTFDFALMYIPAENVYYEAVVRGDEAGSVYAYAMERHVIPVSPTTFYAYLVALVYGLKGLQVEKEAAEIRAGLANLAASFDRLRDPLEKLGEQLRRSQKNYDDAAKALERFGHRLQELSGVSLPEHEPQALPLGESVNP
ncbi:MAG: DNA recombination protein RmuC [Armatimonadota bacterium]|nr:DNA recombination protein RmuC [Armatimonadota bacterium]